MGLMQTLRSKFNNVASYLKQDKGIQPAAIVSSILLATTALATPILSTGLGAAAALAGGIYLLSKTSDTVLNNARSIGTKMGIDPMALGITLGVLTSMPELFVSMGSIMSGNPGIGIGNIVGSNIANALLILGGTAAIKKINTQGVDWKFNAFAMGAATLLFGTQMVMGTMSPAIGGLLLAGAGAYIWKSIKDAKKAAISGVAVEKPVAADTEETKEDKLPKWANFLLGGAGLGGLLASASFVVSSAIALGTSMQISPAVVGLLAVAVGTSLPEIMVSLKAAQKGDSSLAIGNILGSNFFNLAIIGGALSLTGDAMPADFSTAASTQGIFNAVALGGSAALVIGALKMAKTGISRVQGFASLALYSAFTAATFMMGKEKPSDTPAPEAPRQEIPATPKQNQPEPLKTESGLFPFRNNDTQLAGIRVRHSIAAPAA